MINFSIHKLIDVSLIIRYVDDCITIACSPHVRLNAYVKEKCHSSMII